RVVERAGSSVTLEITRPRAPAARVERTLGSHAETSEFLAANSIVNSDDPEVMRIAREVVDDERDAWAAAQKLTRWVHDNMRFDLGVGLASASEVARDRRGTCAAYATFLAALERAAGIPSRYVMGFVYVNGAWGGHAWTEVRIGDDWLPLDAA